MNLTWDINILKNKQKKCKNHQHKHKAMQVFHLIKIIFAVATPSHQKKTTTTKKKRKFKKCKKKKLNE